MDDGDFPTSVDAAHTYNNRVLVMRQKVRLAPTVGVWL